MDTTKFISSEMAMLAATSAFMAVQQTGHYAHLSGKVSYGEYELDVHLEKDELFTLPTGYVYSGVIERVYKDRGDGLGAWKNKKYIFKF